MEHIINAMNEIHYFILIERYPPYVVEGSLPLDYTTPPYAPHLNDTDTRDNTKCHSDETQVHSRYTYFIPIAPEHSILSTILFQ